MFDKDIASVYHAKQDKKGAKIPCTEWMDTAGRY